MDKYCSHITNNDSLSPNDPLKTMTFTTTYNVLSGPKKVVPNDVRR